VIKQLEPEFAKQADAYVRVVSVLPSELTSDTLVTGGPAIVSAYGEAQQAAAYLNAVSSWVASTAPICGGDGLEFVLRILRPETSAQLAKLDEAARLRNVDRVLGAVNPIYLAAARNGVPWGINTLREAAELRESLAVPGTFTVVTA
jgi:hypothetical protein